MFLTKVIWSLSVPEAVRARRALRNPAPQNEVVRAGMTGGSYLPLKDRDLNGFIMLPWRFWKPLDWQGPPLK